jgi:O-antigen/teichoic acid export membrane protein
VTAVRRDSGADPWPGGTPDAAAATNEPANLVGAGPADAALRARQADGLTALLGIAVQASLAMSQASTSLVSAGPGTTGAEAIGPAKADGPISALRARLGTDHMVRNSLYLIISSGLQAALGFAFWIVAARLFSAADVGRASSLISATVVIAYLALLGLNSTLVRYLPTAPDRDALISAGLLLVAVGGAAIGLIYVLATPVIAPRLDFIDHHVLLAVGFVVLAAAASVNLLTDSVFIASRRAGFCALTDGAVGGTSKVASAVALAGAGAYGVYAASTGGFAASALVSIALIVIVLRWRPVLRNPFATLMPLLRFSAANYVANILNLLPVLVVPLIALDRLGARDAAYYFVAFQIATLLYSAAYAVGQAFLAEGSHAGVDRRQLLRRSRRILLAMYLPAVIVVVVAARWVLLVFGAKYSHFGTPALMLLAVAAIPIAACNWSWTVLRLSGRLTAIVVSSAIYTVAICGLAYFLASGGLTTMVAAWPIGALAAALVATSTVVFSRGKAASHAASPRRAQLGGSDRLRLTER